MVIRQPHHTTVLTVFTIALTVAFLVALGLGQMYIPVTDVLAIMIKKIGLYSSDTNAVFETVLWNIRLPRLLLTVLIGAALGVSGAALQGLFRNPLVEPGLIGVSSGSALAVVVFIVFGSNWVALHQFASSVVLPVIAFVGGLIATMLVLYMSAQWERTSVAILILSGVAINALAGALMGLVIFYADENQLRTFTFWTLGNLSGANWNNLAIATPLLLLSIVGLLSHSKALNAIALGEAEAFHMGFDVERVKRRVIFFCALATGVSVSLAGIIGFVGLVVPHLIRVMFKSDNRLVMPASVLMGPVLLMIADLLARTIAAPAELPIGVVTALLGAPFFIFLLLRAKRKNELVHA